MTHALTLVAVLAAVTWLTILAVGVPSLFGALAYWLVAPRFGWTASAATVWVALAACIFALGCVAIARIWKVR